jgi:hypothetical protein
MSSDTSKYNINIHGNVYGLAIGDQASVVTNSGMPSGRTSPPFLTPNLPPQGIFGRDDAITEIYDLLALGEAKATDVPPVALRGMGGIGKTTLAIALGRLEMIPQLFPDGVLWVALGPNPTIRILLDSWGRALGVDL